MSSRKKKPNWTSVIKDYSTQYDTKERRSVLRDKVREHGASTLLSSMDSMHAAHKRHPRASSVIDTNREWLEKKYKSSSRSRTPTGRSRSRSQSPTRSSSSSSSSPIRRYYHHYYGYRYPYYYKYAKYLPYPWCYYNDCSSPVVIHKQAPSVPPVTSVLTTVLKIYEDHDRGSAKQKAKDYVGALPNKAPAIPERIINRLVKLHPKHDSTWAMATIRGWIYTARAKYDGDLNEVDLLLLTALSGTWGMWDDDEELGFLFGAHA